MSALLIPRLVILMILLLSATLIAAKLHWMSVCEYLIQQLHHSVIVSLKGSRSMVVFPPQEAVPGLWLPPASMRQKALGLSRGPAGRGGQLVTWKWLLTLWSKGQHQASPATGRARGHACHAGGSQKLQSNQRENHMLWPFWECHCPCLFPQSQLSDQLG